MSLYRRIAAVVAIVGLSAVLGACASAPKSKDYTTFRAANPRSILVVPTLNNTVSVTAPEFFLSTVSRPFADRGYYVFPAHMVKRLLEDEGLSDPGLIHNADARRLDRMFGCDSVLFIAIQQWDSKYLVISTTTTVKFDYVIKSCKSNEVLWKDTQQLSYTPNSGNGGLLGALIAAAIEKGAPNYMPLAMQANAAAAGVPGQGLPAGPYLPKEYQRDTKAFH